MIPRQQDAPARVAKPEPGRADTDSRKTVRPSQSSAERDRVIAAYRFIGEVMRRQGLDRDDG